MFPTVARLHLSPLSFWWIASFVSLWSLNSSPDKIEADPTVLRSHLDFTHLPLVLAHTLLPSALTPWYLVHNTSCLLWLFTKQSLVCFKFGLLFRRLGTAGNTILIPQPISIWAGDAFPDQVVWEEEMENGRSDAEKNWDNDNLIDCWNKIWHHANSCLQDR